MADAFISSAAVVRVACGAVDRLSGFLGAEPNHSRSIHSWFACSHSCGKPLLRVFGVWSCLSVGTLCLRARITGSFAIYAVSLGMFILVESLLQALCQPVAREKL